MTGSARRPVVVADAGPLIALAKCGHLALLQAVFEAVHIPATVLHEAAGDPRRADAAAVADFAARWATVHPDRDDALYRMLRLRLGEGEAQALSLAQALHCGVLMDERLGRAAATAQRIPLFGVLGVLLQANRLGRLPRVRPAIEALREAHYRLSDALVQHVLAAAGEVSPDPSTPPELPPSPPAPTAR